MAAGAGGSPQPRPGRARAPARRLAPAETAVLVVMPCRLLADGVAAIVQHASGLRTAGVATSARRAREVARAAPVRAAVAVVHVDVGGPGAGIGLADDLQAQAAGQLRVVFVHSEAFEESDPQLVLQLMDRLEGEVAAGAVPDAVTREELVDAVRQVAGGERVIFGTGLPGAVSAAMRAGPALNDRQRQVAVLVSDGLTNHQIGDRLGVSRHTVKHHLQQVYRAYGVSSRSAAAAAVAAEVDRWRAELDLGSDGDD